MAYVALHNNFAQEFDMNVDIHSIHVDDVALPTTKLGDAKCHASLLSSFLLDKSLYLNVNEIISFQKVVGNLDKMIVANLGRQHQRYLDFYFKNFLRIHVFVYSYELLFHPHS